jgi:hypothetical protein
MARGGYQKPANPAPVSGPGALSQRTDTGPRQGARYIPGGAYGDGTELMGLQQSAALAGSTPAPSTPTGSVAAAGAPAQRPTPIHADTERPNEPITAGAPFGAGAGPDALPQFAAGPTSNPGIDQEAIALREAYRKFPSAYLGAALQRLEAEGR